MSETYRIKHISFLQFLGPIFVVLGHSLNGIESDGIWWLFTKQWIYIFHMPLFFLVSGYLLSYKGWLGKRSYADFIKNKFVRLLIPYLFWNIIFVIPKYLLQGFLADDLVFELSEFVNILICPRDSIWGHTWFLVALFWVYLCTPLWKRIVEARNKWVFPLVMLVGVGMYILPIDTKVFCLNDLHKDWLFFIMGCYLGKMKVEDFEIKMQKNASFIGVLAVVTSIISLTFYDLEWFKFIPCTFILLAFIWISFLFDSKRTINTLAKKSFGIYIMHWPIMIVCRIVLLQIMELPIAIVVISVVLAGYLIPNLIISILQRINWGRLELPMKVLLGI